MATAYEMDKKPKSKRMKTKTTSVINGDILFSPTPTYTDLSVVDETVSFKQNIHTAIEEIINTPPKTDDGKKRGRKPKGGKLLIKGDTLKEEEKPIANVILHLKCTTSDVNEYTTQMNKLINDPLNYNSNIPPEIMTYSEEKPFASYQNDMVKIENPNTNNYAYSTSNTATVPCSTPLPPETLCGSCRSKMSDSEESDTNMKDINSKLKKLKINLYKNTMNDKNSACFWCTYEYDNPPCYIPKSEANGSIFGYGSFCRPECAVAYLMKENIDDSTKFERYHLLNQIYSKIYNFKNNIKPAPNPYYLLDKFYGNLSIQEYRKLLGSKHMLLVVDKPLTRILPELHEDTDDFITGIYGGKKGGATQAGGVYKVKRQSEKQAGPSKTSIIRGNFGLTK